MEDRKVRDYCRSILPPSINEEQLWRTSLDTKQYVRKVQELSFAKSPPPYVSPSPKVPSIDDILDSPQEMKNGSSVRGIFNCRKCRSRIVNYKTEQRRGGDEGYTVIGTCPKCKIQTIRNT